ncbi:MAG: LysE family translocator [Cyanobacteria bacterium P01_G01_bin.38]
MPEITNFTLFLTAALVLAITPGPGIFYVLTRSIRGGRREGLTSAIGTSVGGLVHVVAAALGLSALLTTSAVAFGVVKYAGAAYLIYLGIQTLRQTETGSLNSDPASLLAIERSALYQGITTEVLNPKTALFFLAFIPQFVNLSSPVVPQFILLGSISVLLNTLVDLIVIGLAGPIGQWLQQSAQLRRRQRQFSGWMLIGLGAYVAIADSHE